MFKRKNFAFTDHHFAEAKRSQTVIKEMKSIHFRRVQTRFNTAATDHQQANREGHALNKAKPLRCQLLT